MQTIEKIENVPGESGFPAIPTRIKDTPPIRTDGEQDAVLTEKVAAELGLLAAKLGEIHRTVAEAYLAQALYEQASSHLEAAALFAPAHAEHHNQLGVVRYFRGDDQGAIEAFQKVLELQPQNHDALFNIGMVFYGKGEFAEAEESFQRSLLIVQDNPETWNNRGVCLYRLGQNDEAQACFARALELEPGNEDAKANLAML